METRPAKLNLKNLNTYQRIQLYYKSEPGQVVLSPKDEELRLRYEEAYRTMLKWETKEEVANTLSKKFGISARQAYSDIKVAENLFRNELEVDVEIERGILMESLRKARKIAIESEDVELIVKVADKIIKATAMDKQIAAPIDPEKIRPHTINLTSDETVLQQMQDEIMRKQQEIEGEYVEFEDFPSA